APAGLRAVDPAHRRPWELHVDLARADAAIHRLRHEQPDERLEIAVGAGPEVPAMGVRVSLRLRALAVLPRRHRGDHIAWVETEPRTPAGLEGGHQERMIRGALG